MLTVSRLPEPKTTYERDVNHRERGEHRGHLTLQALTHHAIRRRLRRCKHHALRTADTLGMGSVAERSAFSKNPRVAWTEDGVQM